MSAQTRGSIVLETARVISQHAHPAEQFVLRLAAPRCAARAEPGSFVHVSCDPAIPMRRPLSIMRADAHGGWIELLYKVVGPGLEALATRKADEELSLLGPIGRPFTAHRERPRTLLIGGGVGIPPMIFLAERLKAEERSREPGRMSDPQTTDRQTGDRQTTWKPLVLMGSEVPFPFRTRPSKLIVPGIPVGSIACMPFLEGLEVPTRLASCADFPGCFAGFVTELADAWLGSLGETELAEVEMFACGPTPMLRSCAALARRYRLPCQVSLEEFMACAVGGCAGCTVAVRTPEGPAMKRVCVNGPVFDAETVF
jgi:dihydroorotate dehydrogenase electron transfer subunit